MGDVIRKYNEHPEFESLGPDGSFCTKNTVALLRRRPVIAKPIFQLIGKEVDRGTSEDAYVVGGEKLVKYQNRETVPFPRALRDMTDREIARRTGLDAETYHRAKAKDSPCSLNFSSGLTGYRSLGYFHAEVPALDCSSARIALHWLITFFVNGSVRILSR
jgi:hypothetical protein